MIFTENDKKYMAVALKLAEKAKGRTFPNPSVGAVVVANGAIVGRGSTAVCGGPHAEKTALKKAGNMSFDASLYVTLEPCDHFGKTPPCTDAIIKAGIKKVYVAHIDPNPVVCGRGIRKLRKNGIKVYTGLLKNEAAALNEDFFWSIVKKRPWVTLKLALTWDGRIADNFGKSKWITSFSSRTFVHELRRRHGAVAVGAKTLLNDNPKLSVRHVKGPDSARIVFSSDHKLPATSYFMNNADEARSIVVISGGIKKNIEKKSGGIEIWYTGRKSKRESIKTFLSMAYNEGLTSILVEGGQKLASVFMEAGYVNRVYFFYGNKLLGKGLEAFSFEKGLPLSRAVELRKISVQTFGSDVMVTGIPVWR
ncbi:MAG TPA: bifunctional diaminohydroxyphosphoribosylaminopyrimidine deaminase/5-amino-6-(5-phosphoribosylamino)uracil reductase RibD [Fibrobacteres bacterium]|nr:bifunctional diaminohydroxyphosphoribosylaminopyrimidine deaminase/5-amino-6-(5-phosphoribosylamino)uracil reductase RibD [Fibrobacterota bacterium]